MKKQEIVVNIQLSLEGMKYLADLGCNKAKERMLCPPHTRSFGFLDIGREDPLLIKTIKALGKLACCPKHVHKKCIMRIIEIPEGVQWHIDTNEQWSESIHENHRVWR